MSFGEQIGLPILIVGALTTVVGFFWLLRVAFSTGFWWGLLLIFGHVVTLGIALWLIQQAFEATFYVGVLALALVPYFWFVALHRRKTWKPAVVMIAGMAILASPIAINWYVKNFVPDGPRERVVAGETHVTVTGLKNYDYASFAANPNIQVLQMANADVTDDTLVYLKDLSLLKELDVNDTQITDAGLARLAQLPALEKLRLRNTKISDAGFHEHLFKLERLDELDLTGTAVTGKTARAWKAAKEGRKVLK